MGPLKIYLDNSDLINLYHATTPELKNTRGLFQKLSNTNKVQFCYSYWHMFEFIQVHDINYTSEHKKKALFLSQLCQNNVLAWHSNLLEQNSSNLTNTWFPSQIAERIEAGLFSKIENFNEKVVEKLNNNYVLPRKQRRMLKNTKRTSVLTANSIKNFEKVYQNEFHFTDEFVKSAPLSRFVRNKTTKKQLKLELRRMLSNPTYFFEEFITGQDVAFPMKDEIRLLGENFIEKILEGKLIRNKLIKLKENLSDQRKKANTARENYLQAHKKFHALLPEISHLAELPPLPRKLKIETQLDFDEIIEEPRLKYMGTYFSHSMKTERKSKPNDIIDLLHLFYLPEIDLMRCDKTMYEIFRKCPHVEHSKLVCTLGELEKQIHLRV